MTQHHQEPITRLIGRSSLGAPAARKLRARTTSQQRNQIIRKASANSAGFLRTGD